MYSKCFCNVAIAYQNILCVLMVGKLPLKLWLQYECCSIVSHCLHVVPMKRNSTSWILKLFSYILVSFFYLVKHSKTKSYAFRSFFIMLRIPVFKIVCRELVFWTLLALLNWHLALFGIRFCGKSVVLHSVGVCRGLRWCFLTDTGLLCLETALFF